MILIASWERGPSASCRERTPTACWEPIAPAVSMAGWFPAFPPFYNDPMGDQDVAEVLASAKLTKAYGGAHHQSRLARLARDIEQGCETLDAAAVRIHPSYHGYALGDVARSYAPSCAPAACRCWLARGWKTTASGTCWRSLPWAAGYCGP